MFSPQQLLSEERAKLADLTAAMQASMADLRMNADVEKQRLASESERLSRLQDQLVKERAVLMQESISLPKLQITPFHFQPWPLA